jgi:6-phosphofructokinase 2
MTVATLTVNPTIDVSMEVDEVFHTRKMRGSNQRSDPGGGGICVARVLVRLGNNARCFYMSGGATGVALDGLLDLHQLVRARIPIRGGTRVATSVFERGSGREYRFVPDGPIIAPQEWQQCLDRLAEANCDYLVASGSLPRGMPDDFYARVAAKAKQRDIRLVLDSSGAGLAQGLAGGGVFLVKPSLGEFRALTGRKLGTDEEVAEAALAIVARGEAQHVAVSMGHQGALLANASGILRLPAVPVEARSSVGAGDSFLAAMVHAMVQAWPIEEALRFGVSAGAAAVLTPGSDLARAEDIVRLHRTHFTPGQGNEAERHQVGSFGTRGSPN